MAINSFPIGTRKVDVDAILKADADAKNALEQIKDLTVGVTTLSPGAAATSAYDPDTFVLSLGIPEGEQGIQGPEGPPGTTDYTELINVPATFPPSAHSHAISEVTNLQTSLDAKQASSAKGAANGYAGLGADGKVPEAQLPDPAVAIPASAGAVGSLVTAGTTELAGGQHLPGATVAGSSLIYGTGFGGALSSYNNDQMTTRDPPDNASFGYSGTWRLLSRISQESNSPIALWQRIA